MKGMTKEKIPRNVVLLFLSLVKGMKLYTNFFFIDLGFPSILYSINYMVIHCLEHKRKYSDFSSIIELQLLVSIALSLELELHSLMLQTGIRFHFAEFDLLNNDFVETNLITRM